MDTARLDRVDVLGKLVDNPIGADGKRVKGHLDLRGADLRGDSEPGTDFRDCDLTDADLTGANLRGANLSGSILDGASLAGADLFQAGLQGASISAAQVLSAKNWLWAYYGDGEMGASLRNELHLPSDHWERIRRHDFSGYDLAGRDLRNNILQGMSLQGARLIGANLSGHTFEGVDLKGADMTGAILHDTTPNRAGGLEAWQFRGTDVTRATLPEKIAEFKGVERVAKIAPAMARQFLTLLAACLYCWLTIATTTDTSLVLGSATQKLPVVQTDIPIAGFYWFAPLLLVIVFLYFQLNLHQLWEALATLPARFVDGRRIDEQVYPWLLIQKVRAHYQRLKAGYTFLPRLENLLGSALAYGAVPVTLLGLCYRARVKHDPLLAAFQVVLWTLAVLITLQFHRYAINTLQGVPPVRGWQSRLGVALASGALLCPIAWYAQVTSRANLTGAELSIRPDGWVDGQSDISAVKGADLSGARLEHAQLAGAFLVRANLVNTRLEGASLIYSDLRGAVLSFASLRGTTELGARLTGAILEGADLAQSGLMKADLSEANLHNCNLQEVNFESAKLTKANLSGADLTGAFGLNEAQLREAVFDSTTKLPAQFRHLIIERSK